MIAISEAASASPEIAARPPAPAVSVWATPRRYAGDGHQHLYSKAHLAEPQFEVLIPVCQQDEFYPARHDREMISNNVQDDAELCPACAGYGVPVQREVRA